jgi:V-type H+-transporting ATPase subunit D
MCGFDTWKDRKSHDTIICRLKKVQGKKKRDVAAREAALALIKSSATEESFDVASTGEEGSTDLLSSKDDDVIF